MRAEDALTDAERDVLNLLPADGTRVAFGTLAVRCRRYSTAELLRAISNLARWRDLVRVEVDSRYQLIAVWRAQRA